MVSLANPFALALLTLLAVPVIVHLLARGEYRVVPVGSLRWLRPEQEPRWSRLQLRDPWRLALRCLLVTCAVLALSQPSWQSRAAPPVMHVLVDPIASPAAVDTALASLREEAQAREMELEVRALAPNLPLWKPGASAAEPWSSQVPLYSLLSYADDTLGPGPLVVLAHTQAHRLGWRRPSLSRETRWLDVAGALAMQADAVALKARSIAVLHQGRTAAAGAVAAAVSAWAAAGRRVDDALVVSSIDELTPPLKADWIVWLGQGEEVPAPVEEAVREAGAMLLVDTAGEAIMTDVVLALGDEEHRPFGLVRVARAREVPLWRAVTGEPVLVAETGTRTLRLLGPIDRPDGGLIASGRFPALLLDWLDEQWRAPLPSGLSLTASEATPRQVATASALAPATQSFASLLFALALFLWVIDRVWSLAQARREASAS